MNIEKIKTRILSIKDSVFFRIAMSIFIIFFGFGSMYFLVSIKEPPKEIRFKEKPFVVRTLQIEPQDYPVKITGYGIVKPAFLMSLASEINGKVIFINSKLKKGCVIPAGEVLLKIDNLEYSADFCKAEENVKQCQSLIEKLKNQQSVDVERINILERNKELAYVEFKKTEKLFKKHVVGSRRDVDHSEKHYNNACDYLNQILKAVLLYPTQINVAKSKLKSARSTLLSVEANLKRCQIEAPFCARIKECSLENGEVISAGHEIAVLADDSYLEIEIPIDSDDVQRWIQFDSSDRTFDQIGWFPKPKTVICEISWGENDLKHIWYGYLVRIVEFDQKSRTIKVIVRVDSSSILSEKEGCVLPLVDGMFCKVEIPGKVMKKVYRLPRQAVNFEKNINIIDEENRLKIVPVRIVRDEGEYVFIEKGLNSSNEVIITRIANPLEGMLLVVDDEISVGDVY